MNIVERGQADVGVLAALSVEEYGVRRARRRELGGPGNR